MALEKKLTSWHYRSKGSIEGKQGSQNHHGREAESIHYSLSDEIQKFETCKPLPAFEVQLNPRPRYPHAKFISSLKQVGEWNFKINPYSQISCKQRPFHSKSVTWSLFQDDPHPQQPPHISRLSSRKARSINLITPSRSQFLDVYHFPSGPNPALKIL